MQLEPEDKELIKITNEVFNSMVDFVKKKAERYNLYIKYPFIKTTYQLVFAYILEMSKLDKPDRFIFYKRNSFNINGTEVPVRFKFFIHDFKSAGSHDLGNFNEPDTLIYYEKPSTWPFINIYIPKIHISAIQDNKLVNNYIVKYIHDLKETIIHELGHAYDFWSKKYKSTSSGTILRNSYKYINYFIYFMSTVELRQLEREAVLSYRNIIHKAKSAASKRKMSSFIKSVVNVPDLVEKAKSKDSFANVYGRILYSRLFDHYPEDADLISMYNMMADKKEYRKFIFLYIMLCLFPKSKYGRLAKNDYDYINFRSLLKIKTKRETGKTAIQKYSTIYMYITSAIHYLENHAMFSDYKIEAAKRCFSDLVIDYAFSSIDDAKKLYDLVKSFKQGQDTERLKS